MATDFAGMTHEAIYAAVQEGAPGTVSGAAAQLAGLNKKITDHLDSLDKLATSMVEAWPDENGQNFRSTLGHTINYLRELQANHVVAASSSITQVMSASHEKLSHTQSTIPTPPAVPVAAQEKTFNTHLTERDGAMSTGLAAESQHIAAAKADDAKAVLLAKSLANTYLAEKAKLTAPPAAPKGPAGNGSGKSVAVGNGSSTSSSHAMAGYQAATGDGGSAVLVGSGTSTGGKDGHPTDGSTFVPVHPGGDTGSAGGYGSGSGYGGSGYDGSGYGATGLDGQPVANVHGGSLLDPTAGGPIYDAHGNLIGGAGFDGSGGYGAGGGDSNGGVPVGGVLDGSQGSGSGFGGGTLGVTAIGGGLTAAGIIAARRQAAQRASEQAALLSEEQLAAGGGGAGGGGGLSPSQLAAINAQRNGILSTAERAGLLTNDRSLLTQQRNLVNANAALTAEEEAQLAAGQRVVPGQLGGTAATGAAGVPRTGMPFAGGGVVGGAERVTWLVEDRDLFSADPGVRAIIED
jgi:hypothetical protein